MTETLLNAIIHLFAIFTFRRDRAFYPKAKSLLEFYLTRYLGLSTTCETYLGLFSDLLDIYDTSGGTQSPDESINKIVSELKRQLPRHEQYTCLLLFTELLSRVGETHLEETIPVLASGFSIGKTVEEDIKAFCLHPEAFEKLSGRFAVLAAALPPEPLECRRLVRPDFQGSFTIWFAEEIDSFFIRAGRGGRLLLEGAPLNQGQFYRLPPQTTLHDRQWHAVNYSEILALFRHTARGAAFSGENLNFCYPGSKNGLHNFSFNTSGGEMVAIMGGSGAGKSTLAGLLTGALPLDSGQVRINGQDLHRNMDDFQGAIGYVPQDDLLFADLTVRENLYYCARFCLADRSEEEIRARVEAVLRDLGQWDIRDLKVGSPLDKTISGGQRKRLNIALELIREPAVLIVDEPTSGLSSSDSENVMGLLKAQAIKGNLVFAVIHQPSSKIFKLFDRLWILDRGGWPVYDGNPLDGLVYFQSQVLRAGMEEYACPQCGNVTPEQIFAIIEAKETDGTGRFTDQRKIGPEEWHRRYIENREANTPPRTGETSGDFRQNLSRPGLWGQFIIFFVRNLKSKIADRNYLAINLAEPVVLALFIGWLTRGLSGGDGLFRENTDIAIFLFISVIVALFLGLSVSAVEINQDRKILVREQFLRLSRFSYISAKTIYLAMVCALQTGIYTGIANTIVRVPDMYGGTWLTLFACGMTASLIGLNISAALRRAVSIYILIPVLLIPQMLLCGVVINFDNLISRQSGNRLTPVIADIMPSRWGVEALLVRQFTGNRYMSRFFTPESKKLQSAYYLDYHIPEMHTLSDYLFIPDRPSGFEREALRNLDTLRLETFALADLTGIPAPLGSSDFQPAVYNREKWQAVRSFLDEAKAFFTENRRAAILESRRIKKEIKQQGISLRTLKDQYTNLSINRFALNEDAMEPIIRSGNRLVQAIYPVTYTSSNPWGRAQFMAPAKTLGRFEFSTYGFNLFILGLMCLALFCCLYYNLLTAAIKTGGRLAERSISFFR